MSSDCLIKIVLGMDTDSNNNVNIKVTLAKIKVFTSDRGAVRSNKNLNHAVFNLVTQLVGL